MISREDYLALIVKRYERYFDISYDVSLAGETVDLLVRSRVEFQRYFLYRQVTIYRYETLEYCLVRWLDRSVNTEQEQEFARFLRRATEKLVVPTADHMCTQVTGALVTPVGVEGTAVRNARRFRYSRNLRWGLRGWCEAHLVLVDLPGGRVFASSRRGTGNMQEMFLPA